jgi:hypothetical protein
MINIKMIQMLKKLEIGFLKKTCLHTQIESDLGINEDTNISEIEKIKNENKEIKEKLNIYGFY